MVKNNYTGATTLDLRLATVTSIEALGFVDGTKLVLNSSQFGGTGISLSSQVATEAGGAATLQIVMNPAGSLDLSNLTVDTRTAVQVFGSTGDDTIEGTNANDYIAGAGGNDAIDGHTGADDMRGGTGDDGYAVDNVGDTVTELAGEGNDFVYSTISYTLPVNVEGVLLVGSGNTNATGNSLANALIGNDFDNVLDGMSGADTMAGSLGNDTYIVDNAGDKVIEHVGEGTDTVQSSIAFTLGDNLEKLVLTGSAAINGTGNELANTLVGNAGKNKLDRRRLATTSFRAASARTSCSARPATTFTSSPTRSPRPTPTRSRASCTRRTRSSSTWTSFRAVGTKVNKKEYFEGKKAHDKNDHIIKNGNKLFYDDDGKGGHKQVLFAKVDKKAVIDHHDFTVGDFVI